MVTRGQFSRDFKLESTKLVTERAVAIAQAASDLDINGNVLRWRARELAQDAQHAFPHGGSISLSWQRIARLKKENAKLRMKRDILKKTAAYFAKESI